MTGTVTKGKAMRSDLDLYDGVTMTTSRTDSTGGSLAGVRINNAVDVLSVYGGGTAYTWATVQKALDAVGGAYVSFDFAPGTWTIDDDITLPTNVHAIVQAGVTFAISSAKTLSLLGGVTRYGRPQDTWTSGAGSVLFADEPILSVANFGAFGGGSVDEATEVQAAIDAGELAGRDVFFPAGTYLLGTTLTVTAGIRLYGEASNSILKTTQGTNDLLQITSAVSNDPGCILENLVFDSTVARSADYMINSISAQGTKIRNCRINNGFLSIGMTGTHVQGFSVEGCMIVGTDTTGVAINLIAKTTTQGSVFCNISDTTITGASVSDHTGTAISITSMGDITMSNVRTLYCDTGLNIAPATGEVVQAVKATDLWFDTGDTNGIAIAPSGGKVHDLHFVNCWSASSAGNGALLSGTGQINGTRFQNCTLSGNTSNGLFINTTIAIGTSFANGVLAGNTGSGVAVLGNTNEFSITDSTIGATGQFLVNGGWGVLINAGTSDRYIVSNNIFTTNTTGQFSDGGTGVVKFTGGNSGAKGVLQASSDNTVGWSIDFTGAGAHTIAGSGTITLALAASGPVILHNHTTGGAAIYLVYGGNVDVIGGAAEFVASTTPSATEIGLGWSGSSYVVKNGKAASQDIYVGGLKTRPAT